MLEPVNEMPDKRLSRVIFARESRHSVLEVVFPTPVVDIPVLSLDKAGPRLLVADLEENLAADERLEGGLAFDAQSALAGLAHVILYFI